MKRKILLLMMSALLSVGAGAENVWTGEVTPGWYQGEGDPSECNHFGVVGFTAERKLMKGDYIVVTATTPNQWYNQIKVCKTNNHWAGDVLTTISNYDFSSNDSKLIIPVSEDIVSALNSETTPQYTLYFDGYNYTMTSVDVVYNQGKANLYYNELGKSLDYYGGQLLAPHLFAVASVGDIVTIDVTSATEWGNVSIYNKCPKSVWNGQEMVDPEGLTKLTTLNVNPDDAPTTVSLVLTEELLANAKVNGLSLGDGKYTFTSVDLNYTYYAVTIDEGITNGSVTANKSKAAYDETVTLTPVPDGNYALGTLTVTDESSNEIAVTDNGDGTYSFTMPATAVTVSATFTHNDNLTLSTGKILCFNSTGGRVTEQRYYTDKHELWVGDGEHNGWDLTIGRTATTEEFTGVTISFSETQNIQLEIAYNDGSDKTYTKDLSSETSPVVITFSEAGITGVLKSIMFARKESGNSKIAFTDENSVTMQIASEATYSTPRSSLTLTYAGNGSVTYVPANSEFEIKSGDAHWAFWDFILPLPTSLYNGIYFTLTQAPAGSKIEIIYDGDGDHPQQVNIESEVTEKTTYNVNFSKPGNVTRIRFAGAGTYKMGTCTAKPAKYQVTVSALKYATFGDLGSPDVINYGSASGLKAYIAYVDGEKVKLEEVSKAKANTAVILYADVDEATPYTVTTTEESPSTTAHTNNLHVSDGTVKGDESTIYVLADGGDGVGFYLVEDDSAIPAGKAYLKVSGGVAYARQFIGFGDDNETTGIDSLTPALSKGEEVYYDLQGRRVAQPTKGLYIVNGKKVFIK